MAVASRVIRPGRRTKGLPGRQESPYSPVTDEGAKSEQKARAGLPTSYRIEMARQGRTGKVDFVAGS